jgi:CxxC-x17-CxxC domain-containing protein
MFEDKTIGCRDCGKDFVFTAGEQGYYVERGLMNDPQRCPSCRATRRAEREAGEKGVVITCARCGAKDLVPFVPKLARPVYCSTCFGEHRTSPRTIAVA